MDTKGAGTIGARVIQARKRAGLTQAQLAKAAGVTQQTISFIESDRAAASKHVGAIADALGVSAEEIALGVSPRASEADAILAPLTQPQRTQALRMLEAFAASIKSTN